MKTITKYAKQKRQSPTKAEKVFKHKLLKWGIKFRSQRPIGKYIVDFLIFDRKLIIEIDGEYHNKKLQKKQDKMREKYLKSMGFKIIRISNNKVLNTNCLGIRKKILSHPKINIEEGSFREIYGIAQY